MSTQMAKRLVRDFRPGSAKKWSSLLICITALVAIWHGQRRSALAAHDDSIPFEDDGELASPAGVDEQKGLATLKEDKRLPLVWFDVEIAGKRAGRIEMVLFTDTSPRCAHNFHLLVTGEAGVAPKGSEGEGSAYHFKGAPFYRIIHDFIDQAGINVGSALNGGQFKDDAGGLRLKHDRKGLLSMANMGPNTNTAHFSIMMNPAPHLDGHYTIFGQVVSGFDVVDKINALSIGKPENTATAEDGAVIVDCGEIRKGTLKPKLDDP